MGIPRWDSGNEVARIWSYFFHGIFDQKFCDRCPRNFVRIKHDYWSSKKTLGNFAEGIWDDSRSKEKSTEKQLLYGMRLNADKIGLASDNDRDIENKGKKTQRCVCGATLQWAQRNKLLRIKVALKTKMVIGIVLSLLLIMTTMVIMRTSYLHSIKPFAEIKKKDGIKYQDWELRSLS